MFGGYGIYKNGIIFGLIAEDVLYFKVDETNKADYEEKGSKPFTYAQGNNKPTVMSYWEVPSEILENKTDLIEWIEKSVIVSKNKRVTKKN